MQKKKKKKTKKKEPEAWNFPLLLKVDLLASKKRCERRRARYKRAK